MASGSFNIDTFSYRQQLPLSNGYTAYSTGTMFAVGPSSFVQGYSFYDYSYGLCGFPDTSTMSVNMTNLISTTFSTSMGEVTNIINYLSTDALYNRVLNYTLPFTSTFVSTSGIIGNYPLIIDTPPIDLKKAFIYQSTTLFDVINSRTHTLVLEYDYNIMLNKNGEPYNWISSIGYFGTFNSAVSKSRPQMVTRANVTSTFTTISPRLYFDTSDPNAVSVNVSTLSFKIVTLQSPNPINLSTPTFDLYMPGEYNYSFTFYPLASNYFSSPPTV